MGTRYQCSNRYYEQRGSILERQITERGHGLGRARQQEEDHDHDCPLFVEAVTTEVQNDECFVMLRVKVHIAKLDIDTGS